MRVRILQIVKLLIVSGDVKRITDVAEELEVSKKTIRNDLVTVQDYLSQHSLNLIKKTGVGIYIEGTEEDKLKMLSNIKNYNQENVQLTSSDRQLYILYQLLAQNKEITIKSLRDELFISRPSVYSDLEKVKTWLANRDIEVAYSSKYGVKINAGEKRIRKAIFDLFQKSYEYDEIVELLEHKNDLSNYYSYAQKEDLIGIDYLKVKAFVYKFNEDEQLLFTEKDLTRLTIKFSIAIYRMSNNFFVDMRQETVEELQKTNVYDALVKLAANISDAFNIKIDQAEVAYLAGHTIGTKTHFTEIDMSLDTEKFRLSKIVANEIILLTKEFYNIDYEESFLSGLMHHLKSVANKIKYGLDFYNDLVEDIKNNYETAFMIAEKTKPIFEEYFNYEIPTEEIGFIALHIASAVEKSKKSLKTCVLYNSSYSEVKLMIEILKNNFNQINVIKVLPVSMVKELKDSDMDLIISTKEIEENINQEILLLPSIFVYQDLKIFGEVIHKKYEKHNKKLLEKRRTI